MSCILFWKRLFLFLDSRFSVCVCFWVNKIFAEFRFEANLKRLVFILLQNDASILYIVSRTAIVTRMIENNTVSTKFLRPALVIVVSDSYVTSPCSQAQIIPEKYDALFCSCSARYCDQMNGCTNSKLRVLAKSFDGCGWKSKNILYVSESFVRITIRLILER